MIDVTLLGTAGMVPLKNRWLTSLYLYEGGRAVLVDCGEGTQIALSEAGCRLKPIDTICLTHFHADHVAGIAGLLLSMGNAGRTEEVTVIGPPGIASILQCLLVIAAPPFRVIAVEADDSGEEVLRSGNLSIRPFPVKHVVPCFGYQFTLPRHPKFLPEKAEALGIPRKVWKLLQAGESLKLGDRVIRPEEVSGPERRGLKLVYSTDTRPVPILSEMGREADLMILEGQYEDDTKLAKAKEWGHMTFPEAARLARNAGARELWLTHFSQALKHPEDYADNAASIFPNTVVGRDGLHKTLNFTEEK